MSSWEPYDKISCMVSSLTNFLLATTSNVVGAAY